MKFGTLSLAQAEGAILAHSLPVAAGRLRKGRVLSAADVDALAQTGLLEITAAQLEPGDVGEDNAAAALAAALVDHGTGLEISRAFTGRANVLVAGPGVAVLDVAAIEAVNAVDPMITLATVPPFHQMASGGMLATIKIISYAVPGAALAAAIEAARGALHLAPPLLQTARLIISDVPGGAGDKGRSAIAARLEALGITQLTVARCPHEERAIAAQISAATEDLVLVLTGSATSDPMDVAPSALRAAGGQVARFGMPVDPGNLLFIGDLAGRAVIGLPGCARSPALNGADWVLARVICGLPVSARDIAAMGVGGLLKEIPTRPQPRRG
ncbi:MAG: molybdopterin-binding protein [Sulfitobacter sp.]